MSLTCIHTATEPSLSLTRPNPIRPSNHLHGSVCCSQRCSLPPVTSQTLSKPLEVTAISKRPVVPPLVYTSNFPHTDSCLPSSAGGWYQGGKKENSEASCCNWKQGQAAERQSPGLQHPRSGAGASLPCRPAGRAGPGRAAPHVSSPSTGGSAGPGALLGPGQGAAAAPAAPHQLLEAPRRRLLLRRRRCLRRRLPLGRAPRRLSRRHFGPSLPGAARSTLGAVVCPGAAVGLVVPWAGSALVVVGLCVWLQFVPARESCGYGRSKQMSEPAPKMQACTGRFNVFRTSF